MTRRLLCLSLLLGIGVCAIPATVRAQAGVAALSGWVIDPTGAAVPGAVAAVRRPDTGAAWIASTNAEGRFHLPLLPPGVYTIRVTMSGFAEWRAEGVTLRVGQERRLEVQLSLAARDAVTVRDTGRPITGAIDGVVTAAAIEAMPLNGRNFLELALTAAGNQPAPTFDPTKTSQVTFGSAGQLGRGGNVTIDGQDNNDDVVGGTLLNLPIEAVQEFQVATSRFGADLGRTGSSVMNVITRSGTNAVHGSVALFARDGAWTARPATLGATATVPPFDRQQYAGSVGGPLRQDRIFGFGAGEFRRQLGGVLAGTRSASSRSITTSFADAPLRDGLWLGRLDLNGERHRVMLRYAGQRAGDTAASAIERAIGSASQRQESVNRYHAGLLTWTTAWANGRVNALNASVSAYLNRTTPVAALPQLTFPSLADGASFRMPQETCQTRMQVSDTLSMTRRGHALRAGAEIQRVEGEFRLGVFRQGRVELVEDFPAFDRNRDGQVNDDDLLFAVTLRSGKPNQDLWLPDASSTYVAGFMQDDWAVSSRVTLHAGLRYELDTDVNNQSRVGDLNPLVMSFVNGSRRRDLNNLSPRVGFAWQATDHTSLTGGYGRYYDRIVLQVQSLERGLDGRALPIEVRGGNVFFVDPATGTFPAFAPTLSNPFTGPVLPGAGASGINIIDAHLQNPEVDEFHLGLDTTIAGMRWRVDALHTVGRHFLIGRTVGQVNNPVVGGPDRVVNIESSARTRYDALLVGAERTGPRGMFRLSYTWAKAMNYANDDQIPFLNGPVDPDDLAREWGPAPNDRRHRVVITGLWRVPGAVDVSALWTASSAVPMDIMMPDGQSRIPTIDRNSGGRRFHTAADLNTFIRHANAAGGVGGIPLPQVAESARFGDAFSSLDLRVARTFAVSGRIRITPMVEVFNVFDTANILGTSNVNYSGFNNVLARDSDDRGAAGYLTSSRFGTAVSTAGGVFGAGGPRAAQLAVRVTF